jgi:hypothetical protein
MRTLILTLLIVAPATAKDWIKHESKDGRFVVSVPSKLRATTTTIATDAGDLKVVNETVSESTKLMLSVTYTDYPARFGLVDKATLLNAAKDGLKTKAAKVIADDGTDSTRDVTIVHGKYATRTLLTLDGTRLYQVTVSATPDLIDSKSAVQFLKSFQVKK